MQKAHQPITHERMLGGVDTTSPPHLLADDEWVTAHNMVAINGQFQQVPHKVQQGGVGTTDTILALLSIPCGNQGGGTLIALTATTAFAVKPVAGTSLTSVQMYMEQYPV